MRPERRRRCQTRCSRGRRGGRTARARRPARGRSRRARPRACPCRRSGTRPRTSDCTATPVSPAISVEQHVAERHVHHHRFADVVVRPSRPRRARPPRGARPPGRYPPRGRRSRRTTPIPGTTHGRRRVAARGRQSQWVRPLRARMPAVQAADDGHHGIRHQREASRWPAADGRPGPRPSRPRRARAPGRWPRSAPAPARDRRAWRAARAAGSRRR